MKKIFDEVASLDQNCYEKFLLSEDILMEHAAEALAQTVKENCNKGATILLLCGPGNNGGDGLAAARILHKAYHVLVLMPYGVKSKMARLQYKRYAALEGLVVDKVCDADIYVDALFGSGLRHELDDTACKIIKSINEKKAKKISCDTPSGLGIEIVSKEIFNADVSVSMGALKTAFFEDYAKDFVGKIKVADLGVSREVYEGDTNSYLLEECDMHLPLRNLKNSHKGNFGHTCVVQGEKIGASVLAATAAFNFGSGLVSIMTNTYNNIPPFIMISSTLPQNTTALVVGMGLGEGSKIERLLETCDMPIVIDADLFYKPFIRQLIARKDNLILTPHPKEFVSLLNICAIADTNVHEVQKNRFKYVRLFMKHFPNVTLVLKGANSIVAKNKNLYVNILGTNALSKGGSGDILSGMIGALLAQGYDTLDASITAILAHSIAAINLESNNYALNPLDLCKGIKCL